MIGVGQRIGNYRVRRKLGQGGMGAVYEAVQEQIGRRAAIKVLHPEYANDQGSIQRFFNEARAVNIIHHPGLVGVFESGRLEDGGAYIVMEYLDGELLSGRLEKAGRLAQRDVLGFGRQIASALAAAHTKGIVHRDLKPDNIMVVSDPEAVDGERVKVFDFGIAKLRLNSLSPARGPQALRTQTGMIMGTPTHMAPEQCRGASDVDGKADVYSLGVILYQMLVGHPPFVADSASELMSMHMRDKPPSLRKLDPSIPEQLHDLVHSMLAKEPTARPEMAEVVEQLELLGAHRTRRTTVSKPALALRAAGASSDRVKGRPVLQTLQQAAGQTLGGATSRRFAAAIAIALVLVVVSGFLLLDSDITGLGRPSHGASAEVTWILDSEPSGASIVDADSGRVLGQTPWQHMEPRREGSLRVHLQLAGYRESTVGLNYGESLHQKVSLESLAGLSGPGGFGVPDMAGLKDKLAPASAPDSGLGAASVKSGKLLQWVVSTHPRGAQVIEAEDGQVLSKTPYKLEQPAESRLRKLILRLDGYHETSVILDMSTGNKQTITLQPLSSKEKGRDKNHSGTKDTKEPSE
jgi:hypothetical protein